MLSLTGAHKPRPVEKRIAPDRQKEGRKWCVCISNVFFFLRQQLYNISVQASSHESC
jgi:hypothetical protein